ncbi:hypothetical protein [Varunaivibrio sulfuroxidans]|uniref:Uncharacterized protein n=1 Tax=Varunaivibrio sulfuroxidans TaxID=1773489 RepID=A0A4R3J668_9PROT|nr:hypothetical protein [Varunaivibrio sulfuroxidans]TCS60326.1 hypothetical protein EDD55_11127 [Varunaivibrio sulfuroxidans]WES30987.1 hypothetical protein P3M64_01010 [Varunaivibrio sulfuroxidans]
MNRVCVLSFMFALVLGALLWSPTTARAADGGGVPLPHPAKAAKGEKCVQPVEVMRRKHYEFLLHQRELTVRKGERGMKYSLRECVDCHATKSPAIDGGKDRTIQPFCAQCHSYAAVTIDCFECHTGKADDAPKPSAGIPANHGALLSRIEDHLTKGDGAQ